MKNLEMPAVEVLSNPDLLETAIKRQRLIDSQLVLGGAERPKWNPPQEGLSRNIPGLHKS